MPGCLSYRRHCQEKRGRSHAFDIAYPQMRHNRAHKVDDEPDARRYSRGRPPDAKYQPHCTSKLTRCQERKVLHGDAYEFVDYAYYTRVAAKLPESGEHQHGREECPRTQLPYSGI